MVDDMGRAVLADFSLIAFVQDQPSFLLSWIDGGAVRWMSPELLSPEQFGLEKGRPTKRSDCYALGMVVYEILSGCTPFATSDSLAVLRRVLNGERPGRPQGEAGELFTDDIWDVVEQCWRTEPRMRASAKNVLRCLEGNHSNTGGDGGQSDVTSIDSLDDEPSAGGGNSGRSPLLYPKPCDPLDI
jgi:serine/threonine protein kinase